MKAPLIQIKNLHVSISTFTKADSAGLLAGSREFYEEAIKSGVMPDEPIPPAIGEYWAGQGGIYAGVRQYPEGLCHVVFAAEDAGKHAWGPSGTEVDAASKIDGRDNDIPRFGNGDGFPAFTAADSYAADGHLDFCLPSIGELNHAWLYIPESFAKEAYWSSSQRSAINAFYMVFDDGSQGYGGKLNELRVRPVRRFLR